MEFKKISFFVLVTMLFVTASSAQCKIYQGRYASGSPVGIIQGNKIYQGRYASGSPIAVSENGGAACAFAAAAYLLLL